MKNCEKTDIVPVVDVDKVWRMGIMLLQTLPIVKIEWKEFHRRRMLRKFSDLIPAIELNMNAWECVEEGFKIMKDKIIAEVRPYYVDDSGNKVRSSDIKDSVGRRSKEWPSFAVANLEEFATLNLEEIGSLPLHFPLPPPSFSLLSLFLSCPPLLHQLLHRRCSFIDTTLAQLYLLPFSLFSPLSSLSSFAPLDVPPMLDLHRCRTHYSFTASLFLSSLLIPPQSSSTPPTPFRNHPQYRKTWLFKGNLAKKYSFVTLYPGYDFGYDLVFGSVKGLHCTWLVPRTRASSDGVDISDSGEWIHLKRSVDRGGCSPIGLRRHHIMVCSGVRSPSGESRGLRGLEMLFTHVELHRKLHTHRDGHERAGQFVDYCSDKFWKAFCTLKAQKTEEHRQNSTPRPTDMQLIYESRPIYDRRPEQLLELYFLQHPLSIDKKVDQAVKPKVQQQIAYVNYILHGAVVALFNAAGISMSELGSLEPPPNWRWLEKTTKRNINGKKQSENDENKADDINEEDLPPKATLLSTAGPDLNKKKRNRSLPWMVRLKLLYMAIPAVRAQAMPDQEVRLTAREVRMTTIFFLLVYDCLYAFLCFSYVLFAVLTS
ncbi:hypothetical protein M9H77_26090 [Catharanthus roseus]|uniref:Uncharacterized protein n=1 Tax=Catharanthus roseus TaxID=4058 RepID=A0ACC0A8P3_CATRO|nr:hypothetical protein M9H77_26090 [Catharanthus roseus]